MSSGSSQRLSLSIIIPCRNEAKNLPRLLSSLLRQKDHFDEVIVADGMSTDGTRELLAAAATEHAWLRVVDNPDKIVPTALNVALESATGELVARMDTHADYDDGYLGELNDYLRRTPHLAGVGGGMHTAGRGPWGRAIAATLSRSFGLGGARHRVGGASGPIAHIFSGCYRREVLVEVGGWDPRLHANEDFEADIRIAKRGGVVHLDADATTTWYVRESLPALAKQMWRYGYYKGLTLHLHPESLKVRQMAPLSLVVGLLGGFALKPRRTAGVLMIYLGAAGFLGARLQQSTEPTRCVVPWSLPSSICHGGPVSSQVSCGLSRCRSSPCKKGRGSDRHLTVAAAACLSGILALDRRFGDSRRSGAWSRQRYRSQEVHEQRDRPLHRGLFRRRRVGGNVWFGLGTHPGDAEPGRAQRRSSVRSGGGGTDVCQKSP